MDIKKIALDCFDMNSYIENPQFNYINYKLTNQKQQKCMDEKMT